MLSRFETTLVAQTVKYLAAMRETQVQSLGQEDPLEKGMATHSRQEYWSGLPCPGEGNGNPLQYSCLENPMDRGAWWATVYGATESNRTKQPTHTTRIVLNQRREHSGDPRDDTE